ALAPFKSPPGWVATLSPTGWWELARRRSDSMRLLGKTCGAILGQGLIIGLTCALSGCDSGAAKTEYKPIESNILQKLGSSKPGQSEAAQAKIPARVKEKEKAKAKQ